MKKNINSLRLMVFASLFSFIGFVILLAAAAGDQSGSTLTAGYVILIIFGIFTFVMGIILLVQSGSVSQHVKTSYMTAGILGILLVPFAWIPATIALFGLSKNSQEVAFESAATQTGAMQQGNQASAATAPQTTNQSVATSAIHQAKMDEQQKMIEELKSELHNVKKSVKQTATKQTKVTATKKAETKTSTKK